MQFWVQVSCLEPGWAVYLHERLSQIYVSGLLLSFLMVVASVFVDREIGLDLEISSRLGVAKRQKTYLGKKNATRSSISH